jgi:hypothetical protein
MESILGVEETKQVTTKNEELEIYEPEDIDKNKIVNEDFDYIRSNLKEIIESTKDSVSTMASIAESTEAPRAFEVLGSLIKTMVEANRELLDIQVKLKNIKDKETTDKKGETKNINNTMFFGSTSELQKMIKEMNKESN